MPAFGVVTSSTSPSLTSASASASFSTGRSPSLSAAATTTSPVAMTPTAPIAFSNHHHTTTVGGTPVGVPPATLDRKPLPVTPFIPVSPPVPPPRDNLCPRSHRHLKGLLNQCLQEAYLAKGPWPAALLDVALQIATDVSFVVETLAMQRKAAAGMGRGSGGGGAKAVHHHYIRILTFADGRPEDSHYIPGPPADDTLPLANNFPTDTHTTTTPPPSAPSSPLPSPPPTPTPPTATTTDNTQSSYAITGRLAELGGTIVLKGVPERDARILERIMDLVAFAVCHLKLEMHLVADHFVERPNAPCTFSSIKDEPDAGKRGDGGGFISAMTAGGAAGAGFRKSFLDGVKQRPLVQAFLNWVKGGKAEEDDAQATEADSLSVPDAMMSQRRHSSVGQRPSSGDLGFAQQLSPPDLSAAGRSHSSLGFGGANGTASAGMAGSNRFERSIRQIEDTLISCSPDVFLPAPYLMLRLRDEEVKERVEREEKDLQEAAAAAAAAAAASASGKADGSPPKFSEWAMAASPVKRANHSRYTSQVAKISADSKTGLQYYMTNNNSIVGITRHQSITFSYSFYWSVHSSIPCQPPKILTVEYYQKGGEFEDKTLGEYVELLCSNARGLCPDPSCGRSMTGHTITYTHNVSRVSVTVEDCPPEFGPVPDDRALYCWTTCRECGARTDVVPLSDASWYFSFAKYLELLCYSRAFVPAQLCEHVKVGDAAARAAMRRYFRRGSRVVAIGYEAVDLFEMRVPKIQVMPEHLLPERIPPPLPAKSDGADPFELGGGATPSPTAGMVASPAGSGGASRASSGSSSTLVASASPSTRLGGATPDLASLGATLLNNLYYPGNNASRNSSPEPGNGVGHAAGSSSPVAAGSANGVSRIGSDGDASGVGAVSLVPYLEDGTPNPNYAGASALPPLPQPYPFGLDQTADRLLDACRLDVLYFYGSLKDHLRALEVATGAEAVARDEGTPEQVRCQAALRDMCRVYADEEQRLYELVRAFAGRPDRLNNVRRCIAERCSEAVVAVEAWQKANAPVGRVQPAWFVPEYCGQKTCHIYPDSFVVVREDEPTSIVAFGLTCNEYLEEIARLEREHRSPAGRDASAANGEESTGATGGANGTGSGSGSPTLSAAVGSGAAGGLNAASAAAMAVAQAASAAAAAADLARWESMDDYRIRVKVFSHEQSAAAPKQHIKIRFAEGKSIFVCTVYYAEQFENLRRRCNVTGPYVQSLLRCSAWNATGGKSRAVFFKTHDDQLVVKQLASNWTLVEKDALLKFAPLYFDYMSNSDKNPTVLAKIFGFYTIKQKNMVTGVTSELDILVMDHLFANVKISRKFDLKGVPDRHSVSKRSTSSTSNNGATEDTEVGWDGDWVDGRYRSLLMLHGHSKKIIQDSVRNDTLFLASANVMDYSLLVGVNDEKKELIVGIVDFIGPFTWFKRIENRGKTTLRGKDVCTVLPPEQYGERFRKAMDQYFLMVPDKWIKIPGQDNNGQGQRPRKRLPPVL
ncbi:hypothetical protein HDU96_007454 [Phlyctochytrium bullatum]|nr:hypothetical protein HDU96_007454 [Phlyctochytrium bullatum]